DWSKVSSSAIRLSLASMQQIVHHLKKGDNTSLLIFTTEQRERVPFHLVDKETRRDVDADNVAKICFAPSRANSVIMPCEPGTGAIRSRSRCSPTMAHGSVLGLPIGVSPASNPILAEIFCADKFRRPTGCDCDFLLNFGIVVVL
ncbi:MAG: hypothetical protein FWH27_17600, partial [Planctomycetaceae bacterium]|nr:hypothetical protein [Planctomycetaceae bacterium]